MSAEFKIKIEDNKTDIRLGRQKEIKTAFNYDDIEIVEEKVVLLTKQKRGNFEIKPERAEGDFHNMLRIKEEKSFKDCSDDDIEVLSERKPLKTNRTQVKSEIAKKEFKMSDSSEGCMRIIYPEADIKGYSINHSELAMMESMGLPTEFSELKMSMDFYRLKETKRAFYCVVCNLSISSEESVISHYRSERHMKKTTKSEDCKKENKFFPLKREKSPVEEYEGSHKRPNNAKVEEIVIS